MDVLTGLLAAFLADPIEGRRGILADYLEDCGDPRAGLVRELKVWVPKPEDVIRQVMQYSCDDEISLIGMTTYHSTIKTSLEYSTQHRYKYHRAYGLVHRRSDRIHLSMQPYDACEALKQHHSIVAWIFAILANRCRNCQVWTVDGNGRHPVTYCCNVCGGSGWTTRPLGEM